MPALRTTKHDDDRLYGVYTSVVTDTADPESRGRVKIRMPWSSRRPNEAIETWAPLATLYAGHERGSRFIPEVDDTVLVAFEAGEAERPYVLGALWSGGAKIPDGTDSAGRNDVKSIVTRNKVRIVLGDGDGEEFVTLETPGGQRLRLEDGPGSVRIEDSNGNVVTLTGTGVTVATAGALRITAGSVEFDAAMLTVNAGIARFSGVVKADTVITNAVVSSSYTPGAGNIW